LCLTLVLPDGSRAEIPAAWTDLNKTCPQKFTLPAPKEQPDIIATASGLLHLRKIVDSLLGKLLSAKQKPQSASEKEKNHAETTQPLAHAGRTASIAENLALSRSTTQRPGDNGTGQPDPQNGLLRGNSQGGEQ
jgi:hypothetical protein